MKKLVISILLIVPFLMLFTSANSFAQEGDTLIVAALDSEGNMNLVNAITNDTTETGGRVPNRVYVLQQNGPIDTVYFTSGILDVTFDCEIVGKPNPVTGRLPVIAPGIRADGSTSGTIFRMNSGTGQTIRLKNLYITRWNTNGQNLGSNIFYVKADSIRIITDHCVFDAPGSKTVFGINSLYCKLFVTNCLFRDNLAQWSSWISAAREADTLSFVNNTFFGVQGANAAADLGYVKHFRYEHNTSFMGTCIPIIFPQLTDAVIRNNIFYDNAAFGADSALIRGFLENSANNTFGYSIFFLDSLSSVSLDPYNFQEADRNVIVENNAYFWSQKLRDYLATVPDTSAGGFIEPPMFMDDFTMSMFDDNNSWPGLHATNNDEVDPGFASDLVEPAVDSLIKFVDLWWTEAGPFYA